MSTHLPYYKPSPKCALSGWKAVVVPLLVLGPIVIANFRLLDQALSTLLTGIGWAVAAIAVVDAFVGDAFERPRHGRTLEIEAGHVRQYDGPELHAEIDVTRKFSYKILERYDMKNARIALLQDDKHLTFFVSDPGGAEVMKAVVQIPWPPPSGGTLDETH